MDIGAALQFECVCVHQVLAVCVTCVHTPGPCLPVPAALSWWKAWTGQRPSGPRRLGPRSAPPPPSHRCHCAETAPDACSRRSHLAAVGSTCTFWWLNSWRCWRREDTGASVSKQGKKFGWKRGHGYKYMNKIMTKEDKSAPGLLQETLCK